MYDPNVISILNTPRLCLSLFFASLEILLRHFVSISKILISFLILRYFCGDFAAIFCPNMENFSKSGKSPFAHKKSGTPFIYWKFPTASTWVPARTRTEDIQNHNLTL